MKKITLLFVLILPLIGFGQNNVTFQVDMNQYSGFGTPEVNGTFNGWCGNCAAMTDANNDGIWEITISLPTDTFEFKFSHDNWGGQETLTPGMPCTVTDAGFTNRSLIVTGDTILDAYCWESCATCSGTPQNVNVTFRVDLSEYTANTYTDAHLNGTFNAWCGACAPMSAPANDSIYELAVSVPVGDTIEYKFTLDGWTYDEQFAPGALPCTATDGTFTNRSLVVPAGDTILAAVCWESCVECGTTIGMEEEWVQDFSISPNPSTGVFSLSGEFTSGQNINLAIYDLQGRLVFDRVILSESYVNQKLDLSHLVDGIYMLSLTNGQNNLQEKLVITQ